MGKTLMKPTSKGVMRKLGSEEAQANIRARTNYAKTIGQAGKKANETMTFSGKADFMEKVRKLARKQYDLDIFFEGGKPKS
tara:strand:- start:17436 stop:17678 length:243 start_codon:yes stop_codon:yes gene_type:complete